MKTTDTSRTKALADGVVAAVVAHVAAKTDPLLARINALEAENATLKQRLDDLEAKQQTLRLVA